MAFEITTVAASAARTVSGNSGGQPTVGGNAFCIGVNVTASAGVSPSLALSVLWSHDGVNFAGGETAVTFAAITAAKQTSLRVAPQAPYWRLDWAITGTTPSFTFAAQAWGF